MGSLEATRSPARGRRRHPFVAPNLNAACSLPRILSLPFSGLFAVIYLILLQEVKTITMPPRCSSHADKDGDAIVLFSAGKMASNRRHDKSSWLVSAGRRNRQQQQQTRPGMGLSGKFVGVEPTTHWGEMSSLARVHSHVAAVGCARTRFEAGARGFPFGAGKARKAPADGPRGEGSSPNARLRTN